MSVSYSRRHLLAAEAARAPLWLVYPVDGRSPPQLFSGGLQQMVAHINALHSAQGVQFAGREL